MTQRARGEATGKLTAGALAAFAQEALAEEPCFDISVERGVPFLKGELTSMGDVQLVNSRNSVGVGLGRDVQQHGDAPGLGRRFLEHLQGPRRGAGQRAGPRPGRDRDRRPWLSIARASASASTS